MSGWGSGENDQITLQPPRTDLVTLRDVGCWEMSPWVVGRTIDVHSWAFRRTPLNPTLPECYLFGSYQN